MLQSSIEESELSMRTVLRTSSALQSSIEESELGIAVLAIGAAIVTIVHRGI